jgi:hypothetical protein
MLERVAAAVPRPPFATALAIASCKHEVIRLQVLVIQTVRHGVRASSMETALNTATFWLPADMQRLQGYKVY